MSGHENLIPQNKRTKDEQREIARKGGIASGKSRRRKANLKKALHTILVSDVSSEKLAETLESLGYERTNESAMALAMVQKAIKGDTRAFEQIARLVESEKDTYDIKEQRERTKIITAEAKIKEMELAQQEAALNGEDQLPDDGFIDALSEAGANLWDED
ncbi:KGG domain-containing protein [Aerococcaceae bacterium 50-4]